MLAYRYPAYRPPALVRHPGMRVAGTPQAMGNLEAMTLGDWALLAGGAIVGGAGVNALIGQFYDSRPNAISILLGLVLTAVGGTLFVQKFGKMVA